MSTYTKKTGFLKSNIYCTNLIICKRLGKNIQLRNKSTAKIFLQKAEAVNIVLLENAVA